MNKPPLKKNKPIGIAAFISFNDLIPNSQIEEYEIIKSIKKLPMIDILFYLSRIESFLSFQGYSNPKTQTSLIDYIFQENIVSDLKSLMEKSIHKILFHHQQTYYFYGLILKYANNNVRTASPDELLHNLGIILIHLNGIIEMKMKEETISMIKSRNLSPKDILQGEFWRLGNFSNIHDQNPKTELALIYNIYYRSFENKEFNELFEKAIGTSIEKYIYIVGLIIGFWYDKKDEFITNNLTLNIELIFKSSKIPFNEVRSVFNLFSANIDNLIEIYESRMQSFKNELINFEYLREKPLLEFKPNNYFSLSIPFLITRAIHNIPDLLREQKLSKGDLQLLNDFKGNAYETYIQQILSEVYNNENSKRFYVLKSKRTEICDGVIDYGDKLIFVEIKAKQFQKKHRYFNTRDEIKDALKNFLTEKGAAQLSKRINQFKNNVIKIAEIDSSRIKKYYPVLITCFDAIPQFSFMFDLYNDILKSANLLQGKDISPLTIISISEFELIIDQIENGMSFCDLIDERF
jgi:hypothetical protein